MSYLSFPTFEQVIPMEKKKKKKEHKSAVVSKKLIAFFFLFITIKMENLPIEFYPPYSSSFTHYKK
jgi:hypothetical protein